MERWQGIIGALIGSALTLVGVAITNWVQRGNSLREVDAKMVEIAVSVLRTEPKDDTAAVRGWALRVIDARSGTPFTQPEKDALLKHPLPYRPSLDFSDPRNSQYLGGL